MNRYEASGPTPPQPTLRERLETLCQAGEQRDKRVSCRLIRQALKETHHEPEPFS